MLIVEVIEKGKVTIGVFDELGSAFIVEVGSIADSWSLFEMTFHIFVEILSIKKCS